MKALASRSAVLLAILFGGPMILAADAPGESAAQRDARMQWFREARFGMFIHWGLYAIPAGEWNGKPVKSAGEWLMGNASVPVADYEKLAEQFNPVKFDAGQWARIARDAGMKYIVITSKHHDGFCLFDSKAGDYNVMHTPFKRDIMAELSQAAREQGLTICWYHSILDWHHPDAQGPNYPKYTNFKKTNPNFQRYVDNYLKPQVKELLTNYGPIGIMWFDGEWIADWTEPAGKEMYAYCRSIQPDVIVNNRVGKGRSGMQGFSKDPSAAGDYGTPEQEVPTTGMPGVDWESCMTMNDTWGFKKSDTNWKSSEKLIRTLIDIASKGGNFLLNVGPTAEGEIPAASVERLRDMGAWMKINGESIHGTTASPFAKTPWGRATTKPGRIYLHIFDWPAAKRTGLNPLTLPLVTRPAKAYFLAAPDRPISIDESETPGVTLNLGEEQVGSPATVVVLEIEGKVELLPAPPPTTSEIK